jgi:hypothetical protein
MRHDSNVAHIRADVIGVDSTVAPSLCEAAAPDERRIPATPAEVGELAHEVLHAGGLLLAVPFGALRAAVRGRPVLSRLGNVVDAGEAFAARVREYHALIARGETQT